LLLISQLPHILAYFFPHKLAFMMAILFCVSITYFYWVLLPQPSVWQQNGTIMCPDPCGTRWGGWFQAVLYHISTAYLALCNPHIFNKNAT